MREDFAAFILTHGRPDRVHTYNALRKAGYDGKIYIVIDDEDATGDAYRKRYGDAVLTFSKTEAAATFDEADNFSDRRVIAYARNATWRLAEQVGVRYLIQLDDDYTAFYYRYNHRQQYVLRKILNLTGVWTAMLEYLQRAPLHCIAMSQGGDHIGGPRNTYNKEAVIAKRKAMNTLILDTQRPFPFLGRINEDVTTYTVGATRGQLFLTLYAVAIQQMQTQTNPGGMTDIYKASGTYVKSFYTLMQAPSCVKIKNLMVGEQRIHHIIRWRYATPRILHERHRKHNGPRTHVALEGAPGWPPSATNATATETT